MTASGTPIFKFGVKGYWILGSLPSPQNRVWLPATLGLAVGVIVSEVLQSGKNCTRGSVAVCLAKREGKLCCVTQKFE